jgi:general secretion pathway protein I
MIMLKSKTQHGFTLLETLVAFSIFAVSLAVILQIYSKGTRAANYGDRYAVATMIAQSKLAGITITDDLKTGESFGEEDIYRWTTRTEVIENEYPELETNHRIEKHKVEVEVSWDSPRKSHSVKLLTMKLVPTDEV